eukprot:TRINITY_DN56213_c0_g1_i1.p1 TRINITY_DN56213_c0_g1~~TRINITY_DN56213_c0_g1_i1.p1  ORF type:complete len:430 (-),score=39.41 TRINITY_DN56213_c0_g1_i1:159-1448(-)
MYVGPEGAVQTVRTAYIEDTVKRISARGDAELMRTLVTSVERLEQRSTFLWLVAKGFNLLCHKNQCRFLAQVVRGFAVMPPEEQAKFILLIAPRLRIARCGWAEAALVEREKRRQQGSCIIDSDTDDDEPQPFVGTIGRTKADACVVELLDAMEASVRRIPPNDIAKLHRVLERAVDRHITPGILARIFAQLPESEVAALQEWLIEEGTLQEEAARELFGHLMKIVRTGGSVALSTDNFSVQFAEMLEDTSVQSANAEGSFWQRWFQGLTESHDDVEDKCESDKELIKTSVPSRSCRGRGSQLRVHTSSRSSEKRMSCQLHRPLESFLPSASHPLSSAPSRPARQSPASLRQAEPSSADVAISGESFVESSAPPAALIPSSSHAISTPTHMLRSGTRGSVTRCPRGTGSIDTVPSQGVAGSELAALFGL